MELMQRAQFYCIETEIGFYKPADSNTDYKPIESG